MTQTENEARRDGATSLQKAFDRLLDAYGAQGWWPVRSTEAEAARLEVVIGAVLVQHTSWVNVECAIDNLIERGLIDVERLFALPEEELQALVRPAGTHRVKATRLRNLLRLIVEAYGGSLGRLFALPTAELRDALLAVNGVGPETADAILLYAAGRARFVIDAYTRRVVERHGWQEDLSYDALQKRFEAELPREAALFNEYHALLVEVGKRHCHARAPECEGCPLEPMLRQGSKPRPSGSG